MAQSAGAKEYTDCYFTEGLDATPNECCGNDTKQSDSEDAVLVELRGIQSAALLLSLQGLFFPGEVTPEKVSSMIQIELNCMLMLNWIVSSRTVYMYNNGVGIK